MTTANHSEACGACHRAPCACPFAEITVCVSPEETMWSDSQHKYGLLHRNDALQSQNAKLRQANQLLELEIRNMKAALRESDKKRFPQAIAEAEARGQLETWRRVCALHAGQTLPCVKCFAGVEP